MDQNRYINSDRILVSKSEDGEENESDKERIVII